MKFSWQCQRSVVLLLLPTIIEDAFLTYLSRSKEEKKRNNRNRNTDAPLSIATTTKMKTFLTTTLLLLLPPTALAQSNNVTGGYGSSQDPSSYSNVDAFQPSHLSFDFAVNFDDSTTSGTVTHTLTVLENGGDDGVPTDVFFDVWDAIQVDKAEFATSLEEDDAFVEVDFEITTPNPNIGNALRVALPSPIPVGETFYIRFTYTSLPGTYALSWLTPAQTAGKVHPFVYSLCQMNYCRDWAPMMDTPSQKITYDSRVVAPSIYVVSMSGNMTSTPTPINETHSVSTFECNEKIPSYQLALIVGDLQMRALSDRVIVFAEEPFIEKAVSEFEDLPAVLDSTEAYLTPYIWGNYSLFVMPPSFVWGGMEHINANQVSHTLLTGDKSMLDTAIHEITHSWFGNDVGCQNWNHFWINEGMNKFMERKVLQDFYGKDFVKIDYYTSNISMVEEMIDWYGLNDSYSSLFPDVGDDDPENSFSDVPYMKGSQFMYYIETLLGDDNTREYLRAYINTFHGMAINAPQLKEFYESWVTENLENATTVIELTMWDTWVYEPGVAPTLSAMDFYTPALAEAEDLATAYVELSIADDVDVAVDRAYGTPPNYVAYGGWLYSQKLAFVQELAKYEEEVVDAGLLAYIDGDLNITLGEINPRVRNEWYVLGIKRNYSAVLPAAYEWCEYQGRSAYVRPIFSALVEAGECDIAKQWCDELCETYNFYVSTRVIRSIEEGCSEEVTVDEEEVIMEDGPGDGDTVENEEGAREEKEEEEKKEDVTSGVALAMCKLMMSFITVVTLSIIS